MVTNTTTANRYTVSGNSYTISFPYWKEEEIKAVVTLSDGSLQDLVLNTDYSVSTPNGNNGTLTKLTAWTDAEKLTIYRDSAKTQEVDLVQGQKINADTIENALDHAIAINQELQEKLSRSITTSIDEAGSDISIPNKASRAGMLLGFDNSGENAALRSLAQFDADVAATASNATAAANSATLASKWAENPEDTPVEPSAYSAKHWATKASASATSASTSATTATTKAEDSESWAVGKRNGSDVPATDPAYHNNSKYYLDLVKQTISGALRYQGVWTTTSQTDYSAIPLPRLKGDMYYCEGSATTIDGVTYTQGDYIIFNQDVASGTITTSMLDKIDNTETVTPDNAVELKNKIIDANNNTLNNVVTSKNITNCITEIPQNINLTLSSGTLTLKAGSKVYVPNGAGVFNTYTLSTDQTATSTDNTKQLICVSGISGQMLLRRVSNCVSGAGVTTVAGFAYNTTTNQIRGYNATGDDYGINYSFPIAIVTGSGGAISSIDQVFNGMGYIGSTIFALPGLKALAPNGLNNDGTLKNVARSITNVTTVNCSSTGSRLLLFSDDTLSDVTTDYTYDYVRNVVYNKSTGNLVARTLVASYTTTSGVISNFKPKTTFHAVDWNDWANHIGNGTVHDVTSSMTSTFETLGESGQGIFWCVMNRVCYVTVNAVRNIASTSATSTVVSDMPKAKMQTNSIWSNGTTSYSVLFIASNSTELRMGSNATAGSICYNSLSYPVADDWVES